MLIAFDGTDGAGKSTISAMVHQRLVDEFDLVSYVPKRPDHPDELVARQLERHAEATWHHEIAGQPTNPFADEYWALLVAAWYVGLDRYFFQNPNETVIMEKWYHSLVAKLVVQGVDRGWLDEVFGRCPTPDVVVLLDIGPTLSASRRIAFTPPESGSWDRRGRPFAEYQEAVRRELLAGAETGGWMVFRQDRGVSAENLTARITEQLGESLRDLGQRRGGGL